MASLALLLLACALAAPLHAASIPAAADLHKKIPAALPDDIKDPQPAAQEVVAPEPPKEIGNDLRAKPEDIPVEVVVEHVEPSVKINEVDGEEIQRPAVDLRNPGPPQRQEHETQNPERHLDEQLKVSTIKESIERTQNVLRDSFQDVSDNIEKWLSKNDDENKIQNNILNLKDTFTNQIQKLNDTIQALIKPEESKPGELQEGESQRNYEAIKSRLKDVEDNFNNDVETLSAGVELFASLRSSADVQEDEVKEEAPAEPAAAPAVPAVSPAAPATPTASPAAPAAPTGPVNMFLQLMTGFRDRVTEGLNNLLPQGQAPSPPPNAQADAVPESSTPSFPAWTLPSLQLPTLPPSWTQFFRPNTTNQANGNGQNWLNIPNQLTSNWPNFGGIFGSSTAKPALAASPAVDKPVDPKPEAAADKPVDPAPAPLAAAPVPAAAEPAQAGGPIRQFLSNIPVVQRIQNSITNRDTPRVPVEKSDGQTKGGWYGPPRKPPGSGDNNDSGVSELKSEKVEEPVKEESIKGESIKEESIKEESEKKVEEAQVKPESVPEKTE